MNGFLALTPSAPLCSPNTTGHSTPSLSTDPFSSLPDPLLYSHTCVTAIVTYIFMRLHMRSDVLTHVSSHMDDVSSRVCVCVPSYMSLVSSRTSAHVSHAPLRVFTHVSQKAMQYHHCCHTCLCMSSPRVFTPVSSPVSSNVQSQVLLVHSAPPTQLDPLGSATSYRPFRTGFIKSAPRMSPFQICPLGSAP